MGDTTARGYGWEHQKARRAVAPFVASGEAFCTRCHARILPGQAWDLDHSDDRSGYVGAAHSSCNRSAGARKRNAARRPVRRASRVW